MGTFQSLSLEPAPVGFSVARTSGSRPRVRAGGRFTAGVLSARRHRVCRASARKAEDEFAAVDWTASGSGRPRAAGGRPPRPAQDRRRRRRLPEGRRRHRLSAPGRSRSRTRGPGGGTGAGGMNFLTLREHRPGTPSPVTRAP
ncbi:flavin reductase [Nocardiopsis composta]|uniref:flavin reductase n=1 Tax=Nocardiopsis composta TaxID=157465 RepID=UPI0035E45884